MKTPRGKTAGRVVLLLPMLACAFALSLPVAAAGCLPQVRDGWIRLGPAGMPMMAGFGRIENACDAAVTITGANSPAFASVELHETRLVEGVSRMRHLPELHVAPGATAVFEPGGKHLMLMRPHAPLEAGGRVAVSFVLDDGREISAEFEVRKSNSL